MILDEIDKKVLTENFDSDLINQMDANNVAKIIKYLEESDIYYTVLPLNRGGNYDKANQEKGVCSSGHGRFNW